MTTSQFHKVIFLSLLALPSVAQNQPDDYNFIRHQNERLSAIDLAVTLVEKYDVVTLTFNMQLPLPANENRRSICDLLQEHRSALNCTNAEEKLNEFVNKVIDTLSTDLAKYPDCLMKSDLQKLHHHIKMLFHNTSINEGKDFDENLLTIYHLYRNRVKALEEMARLQHQIAKQDTVLNELTQRIISLQSSSKKQYEELQKSIADASLLIEKKITMLSDSSRRTEVVYGIFSGKKNRYFGNKIAPEVVKKICNESKSYKE